MRPESRSRLSGLVAVALVAAAGLVGLSSSPAAAAVCNAAGISAVVDAKGAGGGVQTACDRGSGSKNATAVFRDVGVAMRRNRDGSVCQVNGLPSNATCQGLGAQYWALFWSNGKDGRWVYSSQGVDSLTVPQNGSVAWAWQSSSGKRQPGAAPPVISGTSSPGPTKTPKPTRSPQPTKAPTTPRPTRTAKPASPTTTAASSPASARASAKARAKHRARASAAPRHKAPSASASQSSPTASTAPRSSDDAIPDVTSDPKVDTKFTPAAEHGGGLPLWVPVGVLVAIAGAAGGTAWWRRRTGTA